MGVLDNVASLSKQELLLLSRMAEQCERYEEMIDYVKHFISKTTEEFTEDERNILSVAFKNVVGNRRTAWRVLHSIESKEAKRGNEENKARATAYRERIEGELSSYCREILRTIDHDLLSKVSSNEGKVFFIKMKGDYYRYVCEYATGAFKEENSKHAQESYQQALTLAEQSLESTHPSRIGLALNYSVFNYEILGQHSSAIQIAQKAFDDGIANLESLTDEQAYKESTMILQLIRDNISLWTSEAEDN